MGQEHNQLLRFAGFELDPDNGLLRRNGTDVKLAPQPFKVLALLASRAGELVTREELHQAVWGNDTVVDFEHGLNTCIRLIRTALGEKADSAEIIETVPRLGYRFKILPKRRRGGHRRLRWALAAGLAALAIAASAYWRWSGDSRRTANPARLAVLPFAAGGTQPDTLSEGLVEDLIARLNAFDDVRVISRTSTFSFQGKQMPLREIGARLNLGAVLTVSVRRSGETLEVEARLVSLPEERELWVRRYVRPLAEVFAVQSEIVAAASQALHLRPVRAAPRWPTENPEAYSAYLRGRSAVNRIDGTRTALAFFERAAALDPAYAQAHAGIADAYQELSFTGALKAKEAYPQAARAAERALALNDSLSEAHLAAAGVKMYFEWDWRGAERECRRALELNPSSADARERYGLVLSLEGRFDEALDQLRLAQSLDPLSPRTGWVLASALYWARHYDAAIAEARRILKIDPHYAWAYYTLGQCYVEKGEPEEAIQAFLRPTGRVPPGNLGYAYALSGRTAEAREVLHDLEKRHAQAGGGSAMIAMVYTGLGETDRALQCLETAYANRGWLGTLKVAPVWDRLRGDPRFARLLQKVGLAGDLREK
jgi:adenylate cyclase